MATVDLNHVQFWQPPLNLSSSKQRPASPHIRKNSKSGLATGSRNQPVSLHNKADEILKCNGRFKSVTAVTEHEGRDFAFQQEDDVVGAQGRDNTRADCDDDVGDELPSIEELWSQILRQGISTEYQNSEDTIQHPEEPALDTSGSRLCPKQSRLDNYTSDSQGTRGRPAILKNNELDTPNSETTAEPSKPTEPPSHGPWWDVEDDCFVNDGLCPIPPLEQNSLASTSMLAQGQPYSHHHLPRLLQDQINQHGNNRTTGGALNKSASHSLLPLLDENGAEESDENVSELDMDLLLAFEEQEKLSSAAAPSSLYPHHSSAKPLHPQINQKHNQSGSSYTRLEELRYGSSLRSQNQEGEEP